MSTGICVIICCCLYAMLQCFGNELRQSVVCSSVCWIIDLISSMTRARIVGMSRFGVC